MSSLLVRDVITQKAAELQKKGRVKIQTVLAEEVLSVKLASAEPVPAESKGDADGSKVDDGKDVVEDDDKE